MSADVSFEGINEAKVNLDDIYNQPDPRPYFRALKKLGYRIPGAAKPVFRQLIARLRRQEADPVRVLDIGCSYGVNAALLKHDVSMDDLYEHWGQEEMSAASSQDIAEDAQRYFAEREEDPDLEVIGLDLAQNAINFAEDAGLLNEGHAIDLEASTVPDTARDDLAGVDLVTSTGCVGYVTERSFERLLPAVTPGRSPWFANFVLRMFPYDAIAASLGSWGYATEKLEGRTFRQRRFASREERDQVLSQLTDQNIDPRGVEADGYLHAELYLSRPRDEAAALPIGRLLMTG